MGIRNVSYSRHEPHDEERVHGALISFVYDVPYMAACGVFPPIHILNLKLLSGGSVGGMGPGATWELFSISAWEYQELVGINGAVAPEQVPGRPRYNRIKFEFDSAFDEHQDPEEWATSVCEKHRED